MPSSYTSLLRFELPVQGELSGTWGNVVNTAITTPVSEAIAGTTSISVGATDYTLTNGDGASANEARKMFITATGSPGATRSVICPSASKLYVFFNNTSDGSALIFRTSGSGVTVPSGQRRLLYCDGTNVVEAVNGFGSLTLGTALAATSGGTGQSSYAVGDLLYASSTTALSKLTVGATDAVLTVAAGIPAWVATLPVASGGTGAATLAANNVLLGNGTSAVQTVAPGASGNVLTSNGTIWQSTAPAAGYIGPNAQFFTANGTFTIPTGITRLIVTVVGAGGGAGAGYGGGGAGGVAIKVLSSLTPGNTLSVTVGAGGAGTGGNSSVASGTQTITTITGNGGSAGGANVITGGGGGAGEGGAGGSASNGDANFTGQKGGVGLSGTFGCGTYVIYGDGGAGPFGQSGGNGNQNGRGGVVLFQW